MQSSWARGQVLSAVTDGRAVDHPDNRFLFIPIEPMDVLYFADNNRSLKASLVADKENQTSFMIHLIEYFVKRIKKYINVPELQCTKIK